MKNRNLLVSLAISFISLILILLCFSSLPEMIPFHWNAQGIIDEYTNKYVIFIFPIISLIFGLSFVFLPKIDPQKKNYDKFKKSYNQVVLVINVFLFAVFLMTIYSAYYPNNLNITMLINLGMGAMFCVIGNQMPRFKHNYFIGIRSPWTLASEDVWFKTHRFAGKLWFIGGMIMMLCAFLDSKIVSSITIGIVLFIGFIPVIYSYLCFKKLEGEKR
ncbi:MAG: SdpI family protein [Erysipelotrichaceae bacterium]